MTILSNQKTSDKKHPKNIFLSCFLNEEVCYNTNRSNKTQWIKYFGHVTDNKTYSSIFSIADLLLVAKVDRRERKLAVVANRTRKNTKSFAKLMRFLDSLGIPIIAVLRDSQNFVHAAEQGIGLCEMQPSRVKKDVEQIEKIVSWLEAWPERRRDPTSVTSIDSQPKVRRSLLRRPSFGSA